MSNFQWYGLHNGQEGLDQGLILPAFPIPDYTDVSYSDLANDLDVELPIEIKKKDLIIMTQACDLENDKVKNVTLCSVYALNEYLLEGGLSKTKTKDLIDTLNSDRSINMSLLERPETNPYGSEFEDFLIVKFDESINLPIELIRQRVSNENNVMMKLMPPYREALSQSYGIFFMRIGNPVNRHQVFVEHYNAFLIPSTN